MRCWRIVEEGREERRGSGECCPLPAGGGATVSLRSLIELTRALPKMNLFEQK